MIFQVREHSFVFFPFCFSDPAFGRAPRFFLKSHGDNNESNDIVEVSHVNLDPLLVFSHQYLPISMCPFPVLRFGLLLLLWLFGSNMAEDKATIPPEKSNKKVAFLFMARGPTPLEDIWREFFNWRTDPNQYVIKIHVHKGYKIPTSSFFYGKDLTDDERASGAASSIGAGKLWGNMAQVEGIKRLVRSALKDPDVEWFTLMSESCIPLHNFQTMRRALMNFDKSIVNGCDFGMGAMEGDTRWRSSLDDVGFQKTHWRKSGTWFALKRKHAEIFVQEDKFEKAFQGVPCVDEHYLPSVLAAAGQDNQTTCTDGFAHVGLPSLSLSFFFFAIILSLSL